MTLANFKTYVKLDFKRSDKDTELVQAYNDMIMWVALQMPYGNYKYQSYINTTVGVEDYPLPSDIVHIIHPARLLEGSGSDDSGYPMDHLTKDEYDYLEPNPNRTSPTTSQPVAYTIFSRSLLLTPVPDKATYIVEINWSKRPTALSGDSDTPSLGSEWDETLKFGTLERLYAGMGMVEEAAYWGSKYHALIGLDDVPVGMCRRLFDIEKDLENVAIGQIKNNDL